MKKIANILILIINMVTVFIGVHIFNDKPLEFMIITVVLVTVNDIYSFIIAHDEEG